MGPFDPLKNSDDFFILNEILNDDEDEDEDDVNKYFQFIWGRMSKYSLSSRERIIRIDNVAQTLCSDSILC